MRSTLIAGLLGLALTAPASASASSSSSSAASARHELAIDFRGLEGTRGENAQRPFEPLNRASSSSTSASEGEEVKSEWSFKPRKRPLKGRFLHVTDFHPDPHYQTGATFDTGCHRRPKKNKGKNGKGKGKKGKGLDEFSDDSEEAEDEDEVELHHENEGEEKGWAGTIMDKLKKKKKDKDGIDLAGKWGTAVSKCDSPMSLVNLTFDWLKKEWADEIDFIVWTGDNARHDIDRELPRSPREIFDLNRMMVGKMLDTFGTDIPIVPSIGNNDIWPHNVLAAGPNHITEEFLRIWSKFIPSDYDHVFERGAYFSVEVIPDRLAVISLNTLFWYDSNTLVDGCGERSNDPGALEMDWLDVQLSSFRERGMQVWLTGHVPPHMGYYYDNCYLRYGDLALRYQDTIVGHLFGHMNIDHFFFIDVDELEATPVSNGEVRTMGGQTLMEELRKDFEDMPSKKDIKLKDYIAVNVAASVIPTYLPGVRVFSYNITGLEDDRIDEDVFFRQTAQPRDTDEDNADQDEVNEDEEHEEPSVELTDEQRLDDLKKDRRPGHRHGRPKSDCSRPENEDKPHCVFKHKPRYYSKDSPSRSNRPLSPLGYTQFYLPKVNKQTEAVPEWFVEYTTFKRDVLYPSTSSKKRKGPGKGPGGDAEQRNGTDYEIGEWGQPYPIPLHLLPAYDPTLFEQHQQEANPEEGKGDSPASKDHNNSDKDKDEGKESKLRRFERAIKKITPYKMPDLTIPNYVKLSRKLVAQEKMWDKFSQLM
ncbi:endopolyphosphatase [Kwoniella heveanensis BCC8398]|uniref:Endopolyphosphatase n=1 Tax=Kwoniella heveanensis BCC8398 TaxID=1296120 RepID=A0A1B9H199_9TREE|nr:endopolyphosphatase [Kwoniella heveanensis BCC8398]